MRLGVERRMQLGGWPRTAHGCRRCEKAMYRGAERCGQAPCAAVHTAGSSEAARRAGRRIRTTADSRGLSARLAALLLGPFAMPEVQKSTVAVGLPLLPPAPRFEILRAAEASRADRCPASLRSTSSRTAWTFQVLLRRHALLTSGQRQARTASLARMRGTQFHCYLV